MNKTIMHGKQRRVRGNLNVMLAKFTDNDKRLLDAKIDQMIGLLQERYGYAQQGAAEALTHYLGSYSKRRTHRKAAPARRWAMAFSVIGLLSLIIAGRFVFARMASAHRDTAENATPTPKPFAHPDVQLG